MRSNCMRSAGSLHRLGQFQRLRRVRPLQDFALLQCCGTISPAQVSQAEQKMPIGNAITNLEYLLQRSHRLIELPALQLCLPQVVPHFLVVGPQFDRHCPGRDGPFVISQNPTAVVHGSPEQNSRISELKPHPIVNRSRRARDRELNRAAQLSVAPLLPSVVPPRPSVAPLLHATAEARTVWQGSGSISMHQSLPGPPAQPGGR